MNTKFGVLRNRQLRIIGLAALVSGLGSWVTMMAVLAMIVFEGEGGVMQSSGIFLAGLVPTLALSPAAGWLSDRFDRKWLMVISQALSGVAIAGLIFVNQNWMIYLLLAVEASFVSLLNPARQAAMPDLVAKEELVKANAFLQQLTGIIKILAPMLAGAILAVVEPHQAIIVNVITYALSAFFLARLSPLPPTAVQEDSGSDKPQTRISPLKALKELPALQVLYVAGFIAVLILVGYDVLASVYIRDVLYEREQFYGLVLGLIGAGTLVATILLMVRKEQKEPLHDIVVGLVMLAMVPGALFLAPKLFDLSLAKIFILMCCFVGGMGNGTLIVQQGTLLQLRSPREMLGRFAGLFQSTMIAGQLAGVLVTPLVVSNLMTIETYFGISAVLLVILAVYVLWVVRQQNAASMKIHKADPSLMDLG